MVKRRGRFPLPLLALFAISGCTGGASEAINGTTRSANGRPRVVLVHVGKTGGDSVKPLLHARCTRCELPWQVHLRRVTPADVAGANAVVVTLRDPVERAVSAFNWRHPRGGGLDSTHPFTSAHYSPTEKLLYDCFETANEFANALWDRSWCGVVARRALTDTGTSQDAPTHLSKGLYYHLEALLGDLAALPLFAVRTEHIRRDLNCLFDALGLDDDRDAGAGAGGGRLDDDALVPHKNADYARHGSADARLNATGRAKLTHALATEYWLAGRLSSELSRCPD